MVPFPRAPTAEELPDRYEIRSAEGARFLRCQEAPGLQVTVDRGYSFTEVDARRLGERVILVDGAGQFGPTIDGERQLYNLDHHADCLRIFTLASCEQALVLVLKGLGLDTGDWRVYANEPDLDTILALWVLLNHRRIPNLSPETRDRLAPLVRLEGAIDANGPRIAEYCGLPSALLEATREQLDRLLEAETDLKGRGEWSHTDLLGFTLRQLRAIDRLVYTHEDLGDFDRVEEEILHVKVGRDRVAVVCRDPGGIFEVEGKLEALWGDRLGIVALEREPGHYTLKRTASLAGLDLHRAYERLNREDPAVDGRPPQKRWGGSDEIGGSPRPDGTALAPREIGQILEGTFEPRSAWSWLQGAALGTALTALLGVFLVLLPGFADRLVEGWKLPLIDALAEGGTAAEAAAVATVRLSLLAILTAALSLPLVVWLTGGRNWLFGARRPARGDWVALLPMAVLGSAVGGTWLTATEAGGGGLEDLGRTLLLGESAGLALLLLAAGLWAALSELWFRGFVHGAVMLESPVQHPGGRWLVSRPTAVAASLQAALAGVAWWTGWIALPGALAPLEQAAVILGGTLLGGLALGMMRERSLSVLPGVLAVLLATLAWALVLT